jgi:hypothetical protein
MTVPSTITHSLQVAQEWLKELRNNGGLADEQEDYTVLRAVLHPVAGSADRRGGGRS